MQLIIRMIWLALAIGNSRLHWAWYINWELQETWHSPHLSPSQLPDWASQLVLPSRLASYLTVHGLVLADLNIYLASVVPVQTVYWQSHVRRVLTLADLPVQNLYPTLGIDRALAVYGAGEIYGYPVLVIDAGTALTVTGIDGDRQLVGGAIWPGLSLQLQSLGVGTAALPNLQLSTELPPRWAQDTPTAICSGVIYGAIVTIQSFIQDWRQRFPTSSIVMTGGDGELLHEHCQQGSMPTLFAETLVFSGMVCTLKNLALGDDSIATGLGKID